MLNSQSQMKLVHVPRTTHVRIKVHSVMKCTFQGRSVVAFYRISYGSARLLPMPPCRSRGSWYKANVALRCTYWVRSMTRRVGIARFKRLIMTERSRRACKILFSNRTKFKLVGIAESSRRGRGRSKKTYREAKLWEKNSRVVFLGLFVRLVYGVSKC